MTSYIINNHSFTLQILMYLCMCDVMCKEYNLDYLFTQLYVSFLCARNSNEMSRNCMKSDFMEFVGKLSWILKCNITYCRPRTSLSIHFFPSQTTISSSRPQFATVTARNTGLLDMDNLPSFNRR